MIRPYLISISLGPTETVTETTKKYKYETDTVTETLPGKS